MSTEELLEHTYGELRRIADRLMGGERAHHTLQPTALVHEAFLRLVDSSALGSIAGGPQGRLDYLGVAAVAMRRILIDHARGRTSEKRGGNWKRVTLMGLDGDPAGASAGEDVDLLKLDAALEKLAKLDPRQAKIVELRFFSGMTGQEIAEHLGISRNTVVRELTTSRAWLMREVSLGD